jgi:hypothetical protein
VTGDRPYSWAKIAGLVIGIIIAIIIIYQFAQSQ